MHACIKCLHFISTFWYPVSYDVHEHTHKNAHVYLHTYTSTVTQLLFMCDKILRDSQKHLKYISRCEPVFE